MLDLERVSPVVKRSFSACKAMLSFAVLFASLVQHGSALASQPIASVSSGWSFHWGDIPYDGSWRFEEAPWIESGSFDNISGRTDENILWLKLEPPSLQACSGATHIYS